ncbi:MAG TPA: methyltransferase domain-containing protein [bacterium]|nr:methyltransferase domain-containing protein [bacterium]
MRRRYVHGYSGRERERLNDQAATLAELIHHDTVFPPGARVLEAGCGVGAQTVIMAARNPRAQLVAIDISPASVAAARRRAARARLGNVAFQVADLHTLAFPAGSFDHIVVCFVLEHLTQPLAALRALTRVLKPGGMLTIIEGDHSSAYFHPDGDAARAAVAALVAAQARAGGDACIGRRLYPLLRTARLTRVRVSPRLVYVDGSRPALARGFTLDTFTAMVAGAREPIVGGGLLDARTFARGLRELRRTARRDGTFCYTFFKATAVRR